MLHNQPTKTITAPHVLSPQTKMRMLDRQRPYSIEILFEDRVTLNDGRSKPHIVLLQLTSETLIIRRLTTTQVSSLNNKNTSPIAPRSVTLERHPTTRSLGFSIKGGTDTGFPVLISRVAHSNSHLLHVGDAILTIDNEDVTRLTHDEAIMRLRDAAGDHVNLTVKFMNDMAPYLCSNTPTLRSLSTTVTHTSFTLPTPSSVRVRQKQHRMSAEYPSGHHRSIKQQRLSLMLSEEQKDSDEHELLSRLLLCENESERCRRQLEIFANKQQNPISIELEEESPSTENDIDDDDAIIDYVNVREYSLLYAYVSQYLSGTDKLRVNSFQLHTLDGSQSGIIIADTSIQLHMWISRINMVIRNLTIRTINELNQTLLSTDQVLYAAWIHERVTLVNQNRLPQWKPLFIVFKGAELYIFDDDKPPPLCSYDFICCSRVHPIVETLFEIVSTKFRLDDRPYCFTLTLPIDSSLHRRYLSFETKIEFDEFISNWQRSLYMAVHALKNRAFGCMYQNQICRLLIDIHNGFEMLNNETNIILWSFTFDQLHSSSDNGRDRIYFDFIRDKTNNSEIIHIEVQCQHLKVLIHVINAFLTAKLIVGRDEEILN